MNSHTSLCWKLWGHNECDQTLIKCIMVCVVCVEFALKIEMFSANFNWILWKFYFEVMINGVKKFNLSHSTITCVIILRHLLCNSWNVYRKNFYLQCIVWCNILSEYKKKYSIQKNNSCLSSFLW